MRLFEILFVLSALAALVWLIIPQTQQRTRVPYWIPLAIGGFILALHLLIEQYRWQMLPLYFVFIAIALVLALRPSGKRSWASWIGISILTILLMLFILPPVLFPVNTLPEPTGKYKVGTLTQAWVDQSRNEIYGDDPEAPREFVSQTWYPAVDDASGDLADYLPNAQVSSRNIAATLGLPAFLLDHLDLIETYSFVEAEPANSAFPILIFSHGYNSARFQSTSLMEDLASHGYIVIATSHPYGSAVSVFPDGRIIFHNEDTLIGEGEVFDRSAERLGDQWSDDIKYLLDQIETEQADTSHLLNGRYDLDKIGVFGHSTGGGVAYVFCDRDPRCKAIFGLDAWFGPTPDIIVGAGSSLPSYFLMSEFWPKTGNTDRIRTFISQTADTQWVTVQNTGHYDFADIPFLSPLASRLGISGGIDPYRGQEINRAFVRGFFDQTFKGIPADYLFSPNSAFPEITYGVPDDVSQNDN
ncbi:MAG: hypothetical protein AB8G95_16760 [Anaerolineae bacterium]